VIARSVVIPVVAGGGGGSAVVTLALLVTNGVPAWSVPLTVAELVMVWFCICTVTFTRATAPGARVPAEQVMVNTPGPPLVQATGPFAVTMFICGVTVTVPPTLFATGPAWEYVRLELLGTVAIGNVPLNDGSATPAMVTVSPKANARGEVRVMVTLPLASREALAMLAGTVFTVSTTTTFVAGKSDVFVTVML